MIPPFAFSRDESNGAPEEHPSSVFSNPRAMMDGVTPEMESRYYEQLVGNVTTLTREFFARLADPRRDLDKECGFPRQMDAEQYWNLYNRNSFASRVVETIPLAVWKGNPEIYEDEDAETETEFEAAWRQMNSDLRGERSFFQDEKGSPFWDCLKRADILSGIGQYGVILLGFDDGLDLREPVDGVEEMNSMPKPYAKKKRASDDEEDDAAPKLNPRERAEKRAGKRKTITENKRYRLVWNHRGGMLVNCGGKGGKPGPCPEGNDPAMVNLPLDKRGGGSLDSQIDKWKAGEIKKDKDRLKNFKSSKARAKELYEQHADSLAESTSVKKGLDKKKVLAHLDDLRKWQPDLLIKMLEKYAAEKSPSVGVINCGGPGSGKPGPCPRHLEDFDSKKGNRFKVQLVNETTDKDGTYRADLRAVDPSGTVAATGQLNVFPSDRKDRPGYANLHPDTMRGFKRQGLAVKLYEIAAEIAGQKGAVLRATEGLSDSAYSVWEYMEDEGISTGWQIDRRKTTTNAKGGSYGPPPNTYTGVPGDEYALVKSENEEDKEPEEDALPFDEDARGGGESTADPSLQEEEPTWEPKVRLLYMRAFPEVMAQVATYETNPTSLRYGQPTSYTISFHDPREVGSTGAQPPAHTRIVHWTRVIHVNLEGLSSETYGVERMRQVYRNLLSIEKLVYASPEMFYKGAFPGISFESHPQLGGQVKYDKTVMKRMMEDYQNGLQRYLLTSGGAAKMLAPAVADPTPHVAVQVEAICVRIGIPVPVFKGYEIGEQASQNNTKDWDDKVRAWRDGNRTPRLIVPIVDRLINIGVLPEPVGYSVQWPEVSQQSATERAQVISTLTQAMTQYVSGNVAQFMPPMEYLTRIWEMTTEEAESIVEAAEKVIEEQKAEQEAAMLEGGFGAGGVPNDPFAQPELGPDGEPVEEDPFAPKDEEAAPNPFSQSDEEEVPQ